jgi:mannose-6-phosphate isomerase-like protein (cupin superfamily)
MSFATAQGLMSKTPSEDQRHDNTNRHRDQEASGAGQSRHVHQRARVRVDEAGRASLRPLGRACDDSSRPPTRSDGMTAPFTHINLIDVDDAAPGNGFGDRWEARVAREALEADSTGVTHFRLRPGKRSPFTHRHARAEETYVILSGRGQVKLDDELRDVGPLDAIRVSPHTARAFEAGPEGLELLAFGPHHPGDGEAVDDPWTT